MADGDCWDCGGFDVSWMHSCKVHKGVEFCRGCECPYCAEEECSDEDLDYLHDDEGEHEKLSLLLTKQLENL